MQDNGTSILSAYARRPFYTTLCLVLVVDYTLPVKQRTFRAVRFSTVGIEFAFRCFNLGWSSCRSASARESVRVLQIVSSSVRSPSVMYDVNTCFKYSISKSACRTLPSVGAFADPPTASISARFSVVRKAWSTACPRISQ